MSDYWLYKTKGAAASGMLEQQNTRYLRARMLTAEVLRSIEPFLNLDVRRQDVSDAVLNLFMTEGVEVLTDHTRAEIGLPPRNAKGWTMEEVLALERVRLELMTRPMSHFVANT